MNLAAVTQRNRTGRAVAGAIAGLLVCVSSAVAQPVRRPTTIPNTMPRGQVEIDGAYRVSTETLSDSVSPRINAETATLRASYDVPATAGFSASGGMRVWRMLGVGIGLSHHRTAMTSQVAGTIPHPFTFARPRSIEGTAAGVERSELGVTLQMRAMVPLSRRMALQVHGGPALTSMSQHMVTSVDYAESYPYDTASFRSAQLTKQKQSKWGVGLGADVSYFFARQTGVGVAVRFNTATVSLAGLGQPAVESKVGGLNVAGGFRFRF